MGLKVVTSIEDFRSLRARSARRYITRLQLGGELVVDSVLLARLNRYIGACGCFLGAAFAVSTMAVGALWMTKTASWGELAPWGYYSAAFLFASLTGKIIGLAYAENIFCRTLERIVADLETGGTTLSTQSSCLRTA